MIKWAGAAVGIGGAVVGGYYGVEALTTYSIPVIERNTIEKALIKEGYKIFNFNEDNEWQKKFDELKQGNKLATLSKSLKEGKEEEADFKVEKDQENNKGGEVLKNWCTEVLDIETKDEKGNKTLANAKEICAELKTDTQKSLVTSNTVVNAKG